MSVRSSKVQQPAQHQQPAQAPEGASESSESAAPLIAECHQLAQQLADYGVAVNFGGAINMGDLKPGIEASAAGVMLVMKGICTADEWSDMVHLTLRSVLAHVLQSVEEQRLKTHIDVPAPRGIERAKLAIARH